VDAMKKPPKDRSLLAIKNGNSETPQDPAKENGTIGGHPS
jgi:hypothetical protein